MTHRILLIGLTVGLLALGMASSSWHIALAQECDWQRSVYWRKCGGGRWINNNLEWLGCLPTGLGYTCAVVVDLEYDCTGSVSFYIDGTLVETVTAPTNFMHSETYTLSCDDELELKLTDSTCSVGSDIVMIIRGTCTGDCPD